jgi:hypothetical protein
MGGDETVVDGGGRRHDALLDKFTAHVRKVFEAFHWDTVDIVLMWQHRYVFVQPDVRQFPSEEVVQTGVVVGRRCSQNLGVVNPWSVTVGILRKQYTPRTRLVGRVAGRAPAQGGPIGARAPREPRRFRNSVDESHAEGWQVQQRRRTCLRAPKPAAHAVLRDTRPKLMSGEMRW